MSKARLIAVAVLVMSGWTGTAFSQAAPGAPVFVAGSDVRDFQIHCQKDGKTTMGIFRRGGSTGENQVARNITYVPIGGGKYALHFNRGFTTASAPDVYFPAIDESCEVTLQ